MPIIKNKSELETLPNIDINIKCGNSLISRFELDVDIKKTLKDSKWTIDDYKKAVDTYRNAQNKEQKQKMEKLIDDIKNNFRSVIYKGDPKVIRLKKLHGEMFAITNQRKLFEPSKKEKADFNKKLKKLTANAKKLEIIIEDIKSNKIYENAFEWRFEFPEALNSAGDFVGFDIVIGNPPYLIEYNKNIKSFLENKYLEFKRNNDLYIAFIILGNNCLKTNGLHSFITPNTFIKGSYFKQLRAFLITQKIIEIIDFKNDLIFEDANVYCAILTYKKNNNTQDWILKSKLNQIEGKVEKEQLDFIVKNKLTKKLDKINKFEDFFEIKDVGFNYWSIGRGKIRGNSVGSRILYKGNILNPKDQPYLKGGNIFRYYNSKPNNYLRHNYNDYLTENDIFRFSQLFFEISPKIIYRQTSKEIIATIDYEKHFNDKTVHILSNKTNFNYDLRLILGILNSKLINYYLRQYKQEGGKAFAQIKTVDVKNFPFKYSQKLENSFIKKIDKILSSKKQNPEADTSQLENEIDQLVYKLYDLTKDEIKIIEQANK